jgi:hypothetical protein
VRFDDPIDRNGAKLVDWRLEATTSSDTTTGWNPPDEVPSDPDGIPHRHIDESAKQVPPIAPAPGRKLSSGWSTWRSSTERDNAEE